jgi:hypothetical protein
MQQRNQGGFLLTLVRESDRALLLFLFCRKNSLLYSLAGWKISWRPMLMTGGRERI